MKPFVGGFGGRVEEGEDPLEGAKRELLEEAGYTARDWVLWKSVQPISKIEWAVYVFIAKGLEYTGHNNLDSGERIQIKKVSFDDFLQLARNPSFSEYEVKDDMYEALLDQNAYEILKKRFCI
jgi:ADP-ribose pyrophosphatase